MRAMITILRLLSLFLPALASHAAVNDVMLRDYFSLQPGQTTLTVYACDREFQGPYAGENRWRYVLSAGRQKDTTPRFLVDPSPEIAFYDDNNGYTGNRKLEQRRSYALTGREILLRYQKGF